jgi:hypothetical protein
VDGVPEQQDQALQHRDLDEEEAQADQEEVDGGGTPQGAAGPPREQPRRQQDERQPGQDGHAQRGQLQRPTPVEQARVALPRRRPERRQRAPAEEVEEVGPVVRGRADVEGVARDEGGPPRPGQRGDAVEEHGLAQEVEPVGGRAGHPGAPADVEGERLGEGVDRGELLRPERRPPDQQQHAVPGPDQHQVPRRLGHAEPFQRLERGQRQLQAVARREAQRVRHG